MDQSSELLSALIRNQCVNTGEENSGNESKSCETLLTLFSNYSSSVQVERHCKVEKRENLIVRLEGSERDSPSLLLLGHLDVVPANASDWDFDPFAGEIKNNFVHGRGAIDMLNLTSSMALALKELIDEGFSPKGNLIFAAVADEESGGKLGAEYLLDEHSDLVKADYVLTESGGTQMPLGNEIYLPIVIGEKGVHWLELEIAGTPTHGSKPYGADNAVISASEIVKRLSSYKSPLKFTQGWETFLNALGIDKSVSKKLANDKKHDDALKLLDGDLASVVHSCCHNTISPNVISGGVKVNTVADQVKLLVDIRTLPGVDQDDLNAMLNDCFGDLTNKVKFSYLSSTNSTISNTENDFYRELEQVVDSMVSGSKLLPVIASYGTDARFFRSSGAQAYGFGMFSKAISYIEHLNMFHSRNEKVDVESLELTKLMYKKIIKAFL